MSMSAKEKMCTAFKVAAVWQQEELDGKSIFDFSDITCQHIVELVNDFVELLNKEQLEQMEKTPEEFGHWLCLEQMGHGSGFYDSTIKCVADISDTLDDNELMRFNDVYVDDDGILQIDFFTYGKPKQ